MDTIGSSLQGIWNWDRIRVKQSLESSVTLEAVGKVLCSPLQPEAEEAGHQEEQQVFRAQQSASWCIHPDSQQDSCLRFQRTCQYPYHTFSVL